MRTVHQGRNNREEGDVLQGIRISLLAENILIGFVVPEN